MKCWLIKYLSIYKQPPAWRSTCHTVSRIATPAVS